jgi:MFS transporter, putative metabolite:H+ symporter
MTTSLAVQSGARLDNLQASRFHLWLAALIGGGMFFDGFDLFLAGNVLGAVLHTGFSTLALNGWFASATFLGMTIGAFCSGWIGDHLGRRVTYQVNLLIFGIASIAAALAPNMEVLIVARFVMGVGLGAEIVVGYATYTEFLPPAVRGRWLGILAMPMQVALFVSSLCGLLIIPSFGWRPMFWISAVGALIVWYLRKNIPESPRWLEHKGRFEEAERVVHQIEVASGQPENKSHVPERPRTALPKSSLRNPQLLLRLFVGSVTVIVLNVVVFGFLTFVPTFFVKAGLSVVKSLGFTTIMTLGGPIGGIIALMVVDKIGRKGALIASALIAAVIGCFYPYVGNGLMITAVGLALVTSIYVNSVTGYSMFVPELFPTDVRLSGVGICHTIGRLAGAIVPALILFAYGNYGMVGVLAFMVACLIVQAIVVGALGVEPRHRSLEELIPQDTDALRPHNQSVSTTNAPQATSS